MLFRSSLTAEVLVKRGHSVVVLDDLSMGHRQAVHPEAAFIHADFTDSESVVFALLEHDIEAVIHFALLSKPDSAVEYFERNTIASLSFLQTLLKYGIRKLVLSFTATSLETLVIDERTSIPPTDTYGESIYLVERMLPWLNQTQGLSYGILRHASAAGEAERSVPRRQILGVAKAHVLALESLNDGDARTYNLDDSFSFRDLDNHSCIN